MSGITILTEQNKTVVYTDLAGLGVNESPQIMNDAVSVISTYPEKSVCSLVDMTDMRFNKDVIAKVTEIARLNAPYVTATAIVGLNSVAKLIARSVIKLTGRNTSLFENIDEAKAWLLNEKSAES